MAKRRVHKLTPKQLRALLKEEARVRLMKQIGQLLVNQSRDAFQEQKLGDALWPARYPKMKEPFINLAPVIRAAGEGRPPGSDDFVRRPALGGAGSELSRSIAYRLDKNFIEVGTNAQHMKPELFQFGGWGSVPITDTTRYTLAMWLGIATRKPSKAKVKVSGRGKDEYIKKLAFIFRDGKTEHRQKAYARPFIGFTDETYDKCAELIEDWVGSN